MYNFSIDDELEITIDIISRLRDKWSGLTLEANAAVLKIMTERIILGKNGKHSMEIEWEQPWNILGKRVL